MSNWAGVWIGVWEGQWEGADAPGGMLNTGLVVVGMGFASFGAELTIRETEEPITGGGGYADPYDLAERRRLARKKKREEDARELAEQQARANELARAEAEAEYLASIERYRDIQSRKLDEYIAQEPPRFLAALDIGAEIQAIAEDALAAHATWLAEQETFRIRREEEEALIVLLLAL